MLKSSNRNLYDFVLNNECFLKARVGGSHIEDHKNLLDIFLDLEYK